jgi:hypothetical protein
MKKFIYLTVSFIILIGLDIGLSKTTLPINQFFYLLGFEKFRSHAEETIGQKRIILVGGSSLGWGVSAEKLSMELGVLTLNSGIFAGIGFKNFIRLIEDVIDKDNDILVISPEYEIVSEFSRFSRNADFCYISVYVGHTYPLECMGQSLNQIFRVFPTIDRSDPDYIRAGFNDFGDYVYRRTQKMNIDYELNSDYCSTWTLADLRNIYIPYIRDLQSHGYNVIYIPNFLLEGSCRETEKISQFHQALFDEFGVRGFEEPQLEFNELFFYNTRYHLTNEGVEMKTKVFENQLRSYLANQ